MHHRIFLVILFLVCGLACQERDTVVTEAHAYLSVLLGAPTNSRPFNPYDNTFIADPRKRIVDNIWFRSELPEPPCSTYVYGAQDTLVLTGDSFGQWNEKRYWVRHAKFYGEVDRELLELLNAKKDTIRTVEIRTYREDSKLAAAMFTVGFFEPLIFAGVAGGELLYSKLTDKPYNWEHVIYPTFALSLGFGIYTYRTVDLQPVLKITRVRMR